MKIRIPYTPLDHQTILHNNPTRFLVAVTGRQIGKTTAAVNELIKRAITRPNTRNWYVTNDYRQAKRNVWQLLKQYLPKEITVSLNSSELSATLSNNSRIELIGVENAERLRGAVVHFMVLDEYADFDREVWPTVLRPMLSTTKGDVWFIGTPKGMGNDFHDKYFAKDIDTTVYKFPSCTIHNHEVVSTLSKYANIDEIKSAHKSLPKDAFDQEYLAEFTRPSGVVYKDWPLENYKDVPYDPFLPLHISLDFGVNDPTSVIWIQPSGSEFRIIDYYEMSNADIAHFIQVIKSKPYKSPELVTGDDAGRARTLTTGTSPIDELGKAGIFVRTTPGLKIPDQIRTAYKHLKELFIDTKAQRLRDCILNYHYPEKNENVINQSNEIPMHDEWSHGMRALEYYFCNYKGDYYNNPVLKSTKNWSIA